MQNFITHIDIRNFKSLDECRIDGCKRINLFIGRPNVGKSNILEALSVFTMPFLSENTSKKLSGLIRVENETELFYDGNINSDALVKTNLNTAVLNYYPKSGLNVSFYSEDAAKPDYNAFVNDKLLVKTIFRNKELDFYPVKKYTFRQDVTYRKAHAKYLIPPFGYNLLAVLNNYPELKKEIQALFAEYKLQMAFDKSSQEIKIVKGSGSSELFLIPYSSIADTLQRIIFFKSAIASNNNSVLLFEEPEAHAFPPYITHITQEMIHKRDNQYFIATHSPFILNDFLENAREELAVYIVHYDEYATQVRQLSHQELHKVYQNGVDLFTNSESFI